MIVTRYFIKAENESTGMSGYLPLWIPRSAGFDPGFLRGLIHDALEHRLCDSGKLHEEAMAFGRLLACRVHTGHFGQRRYRTDEESLGQEFGSECWRAYAGSDGNWRRLMPEPPPVHKRLIEDYARESIKELVQTCARQMRREQSYEESASSNEFGPGARASFFTRMAKWMAIGYADATRRYARVGLEAVSDAFFWADDAHNEARFNVLQEEAQEGECLRMVIDLRQRDIRLEPIAFNDSFDGYSSWLRQRVRQWRLG